MARHFTLDISNFKLVHPISHRFAEADMTMDTWTVFRRGGMLALLLLLEGCGLNSVRPLPAGRPIRDNSAVLVYDVGIESKWRAQLCSLQLDEYDIERQVATGNCYRFNHADAVFPGMPGPIHYFAFEVPAGRYIYSAFNSGCEADVRRQAYAAPAGRIVFVGNFVYGKDKRLALRRDLATFERQRDTVLPELKGKVTLAQAMQVKPAGMFIWAP